MERQRRRVRDIKGLDPPRKIKPRELVATRARRLPQSFSLRAQYERKRCAQRRVAQVDVSRAVEPDEKVSALAQRC